MLASEGSLLLISALLLLVVAGSAVACRRRIRWLRTARSLAPSSFLSVLTHDGHSPSTTMTTSNNEGGEPGRQRAASRKDIQLGCFTSCLTVKQCMERTVGQPRHQSRVQDDERCCADDTDWIIARARNLSTARTGSARSATSRQKATPPPGAVKQAGAPVAPPIAAPSDETRTRAPCQFASATFPPTTKPRRAFRASTQNQPQHPRRVSAGYQSVCGSILDGSGNDQDSSSGGHPVDEALQRRDDGGYESNTDSNGDQESNTDSKKATIQEDSSADMTQPRIGRGRGRSFGGHQPQLQHTHWSIRECLTCSLSFSERR